jgi:hypothetical protein
MEPIRADRAATFVTGSHSRRASATTHASGVSYPAASQTMSQSDAASGSLAEVWGDTVDLKHLAWSIVLGVGISLGAFLIAKSLLAQFVTDAAIGRAYAMLVGLAGCVLAGAVCALLFKPKRLVVEHTVDESERMHVLEQLAAESGGLGSIADLSRSARSEMEELGLLSLFADFEAAEARRRVEEDRAQGAASSHAAHAVHPVHSAHSVHPVQKGER